MSDSRAAGAEREEELEEIRENLKAGDTFFVGNRVPGGMPSSVRPNKEYTLISRSSMGEKIWTLNGDEDYDYDFQLREKLVAELVRLFKRSVRRRNEKAPPVAKVKAAEAQNTKDEMPKPETTETKLKPVTEAQLVRLYEVIEARDEDASDLALEALDLLLDRELALLGLKLEQEPEDTNVKKACCCEERPMMPDYC